MAELYLSDGSKFSKIPLLTETVTTDTNLDNHTKTGYYVVRGIPSTGGNASSPVGKWASVFTDADIDTPFQIAIPDGAASYLYKRALGSSTWTKMSAGYADSAGSANTEYSVQVSSTQPTDSFNPYAPYMPMQNSAYPPANQIQGVRFVSNRQEAESCAVPRGTKALLMDSNKDIFYLKETDMNGISTISEYSFKKVEPQTADNYITKDEFNKWKEQYESIISNIAANTNAAKQPNDRVVGLH